MIKNFYNFLTSINERSDKKNKLFIYSQAIRNARKEENMTLEDLSRGISSVSYLSKLERNIIEADSYYLKAFFEKLNIKYEDIDNDYSSELENTLRFYRNKNYDEINNIYNELDDSHFFGTKSLIKCFYFLSNKLYTKFSEEIKKIDNIKDNLDRFESLVLIFLVMRYYADRYQFKEASKYISVILNLRLDNNILKSLLFDVVLEVSFNLRQSALFYHTIELMDNNSSLYYPVENIVRNRNMKLDLLLSEGEVILDNPSYNEINDDDFYFRLIRLYRRGLYLEGLKLLNDREIKNDDLFLIFGYLAYLSQEVKYINRFKKEINKFDFSKMNQENKMFFEYINLLLIDDKSYKVFEFLRKKAIPHSDNYQHFLYLDIYKNRYLNFLAELSRYKDIWLYYSSN